jgi:hypothetical protein
MLFSVLQTFDIFKAFCHITFQDSTVHVASVAPVSESFHCYCVCITDMKLKSKKMSLSVVTNTITKICNIIPIPAFMYYVLLCMNVYLYIR